MTDTAARPLDWPHVIDVPDDAERGQGYISGLRILRTLDTADGERYVLDRGNGAAGETIIGPLVGPEYDAFLRRWGYDPAIAHARPGTGPVVVLDGVPAADAVPDVLTVPVGLPALAGLHQWVDSLEHAGWADLSNFFFFIRTHFPNPHT